MTFDTRAVVIWARQDRELSLPLSASAIDEIEGVIWNAAVEVEVRWRRVGAEGALRTERMRAEDPVAELVVTRSATATAHGRYVLEGRLGPPDLRSGVDEEIGSEGPQAHWVLMAAWYVVVVPLYSTALVPVDRHDPVSLAVPAVSVSLGRLTPHYRWVRATVPTVVGAAAALAALLQDREMWLTDAQQPTGRLPVRYASPALPWAPSEARQRDTVAVIATATPDQLESWAAIGTALLAVRPRESAHELQWALRLHYEHVARLPDEARALRWFHGSTGPALELPTAGLRTGIYCCQQLLARGAPDDGGAQWLTRGVWRLLRVPAEHTLQTHSLRPAHPPTLRLDAPAVDPALELAWTTGTRPELDLQAGRGAGVLWFQGATGGRPPAGSPAQTLSGAGGERWIALARVPDGDFPPAPWLEGSDVLPGRMIAPWDVELASLESPGGADVVTVAGQQVTATPYRPELVLAVWRTDVDPLAGRTALLLGAPMPAAGLQVADLAPLVPAAAHSSVRWTLERAGRLPTPLAALAGSVQLRIYGAAPGGHVGEGDAGLYRIRWRGGGGTERSLQVLVTATGLCVRSGIEYTVGTEGPSAREARWHSWPLPERHGGGGAPADYDRTGGEDPALCPMLYYGPRTERRCVELVGGLGETRQGSVEVRTWACCRQPERHPGCWVGRHAWQSRLPDLLDTYGGRPDGTAWLFSADTNPQARAHIASEASVGHVRRVLELEARFNAVQGGRLNLTAIEESELEERREHEVRRRLFAPLLLGEGVVATTTVPPPPHPSDVTVAGREWWVRHAPTYERWRDGGARSQPSDRLLDRAAAAVRRQQERRGVRERRDQLTLMELAQLAQLRLPADDRVALMRALDRGGVDELFEVARGRELDWAQLIADHQVQLDRHILEVDQVRADWGTEVHPSPIGLALLDGALAGARGQLTRERAALATFRSDLDADLERWRRWVERVTSWRSGEFAGRLATTRALLNDLGDLDATAFQDRARELDTALATARAALPSVRGQQVALARSMLDLVAEERRKRRLDRGGVRELQNAATEEWRERLDRFPDVSALDGLRTLLDDYDGSMDALVSSTRAEKLLSKELMDAARDVQRGGGASRLYTAAYVNERAARMGSERAARRLAARELSARLEAQMQGAQALDGAHVAPGVRTALVRRANRERERVRDQAQTARELIDGALAGYRGGAVSTENVPTLERQRIAQSQQARAVLARIDAQVRDAQGALDAAESAALARLVTVSQQRVVAPTALLPILVDIDDSVRGRERTLVGTGARAIEDASAVELSFQQWSERAVRATTAAPTAPDPSTASTTSPRREGRGEPSAPPPSDPDATTVPETDETSTEPTTVPDIDDDDDDDDAVPPGGGQGGRIRRVRTQVDDAQRVLAGWPVSAIQTAGGVARQPQAVRLFSSLANRLRTLEVRSRDAGVDTSAEQVGKLEEDTRVFLSRLETDLAVLWTTIIARPTLQTAGVRDALQRARERASVTLARSPELTQETDRARLALETARRLVARAPGATVDGWAGPASDAVDAVRFAATSALDDAAERAMAEGDAAAAHLLRRDLSTVMLTQSTDLDGDSQLTALRQATQRVVRERESALDLIYERAAAPIDAQAKGQVETLIAELRAVQTHWAERLAATDYAARLAARLGTERALSALSADIDALDLPLIKLEAEQNALPSALDRAAASVRAAALPAWPSFASLASDRYEELRVALAAQRPPSGWIGELLPLKKRQSALQADPSTTVEQVAQVVEAQLLLKQRVQASTVATAALRSELESSSAAMEGVPAELQQQRVLVDTWTASLAKESAAVADWRGALATAGESALVREWLRAVGAQEATAGTPANLGDAVIAQRDGHAVQVLLDELVRDVAALGNRERLLANTRTAVEERRALLDQLAAAPAAGTRPNLVDILVPVNALQTSWESLRGGYEDLDASAAEFTTRTLPDRVRSLERAVELRARVPRVDALWNEWFADINQMLEDSLLLPTLENTRTLAAGRSPLFTLQVKRQAAATFVQLLKTTATLSSVTSWRGRQRAVHTAALGQMLSRGITLPGLETALLEAVTVVQGEIERHRRIPGIIDGFVIPDLLSTNIPALRKGAEAITQILQTTLVAQHPLGAGVSVVSVQ